MFPEWQAAAGVGREQRRGRGEGDAHAGPRPHGEHGGERMDSGRWVRGDEWPENVGRQGSVGLHLHDRGPVAIAHRDGIGSESWSEAFDGVLHSACVRGRRVALVPNQRLVVVAMGREWDLVDRDHLDHSAAGRDRPQRVAAAAAAERESVGVGVRVACVHRLDPHGRAGRRESRCGFWQPRVVGIPAEQAAEQAHVGALRLMRGR